MSYKMLNAVATIALGWLVSTGLAGPSFAQNPQKKLPYPNVTDTSHATNKVAHIFEGYFRRRACMMVLQWCPSLGQTQCSTSTLAWGLLGHRGPRCCRSGPIRHSRQPPDALSYPLRVIGDYHSALIEFVDTPPLLGKEFRFLSSITFNDKCQIVRWIDYWDGRSSQTKIPIGTFGPYPPDFHDGVVNASATIKKVAQALQNAFSAGDAARRHNCSRPTRFSRIWRFIRALKVSCKFSGI